MGDRTNQDEPLVMELKDLAVDLGLRVHAPGSMAFRFDVAKRSGSPRVVVSASVTPSWPR